MNDLTTGETAAANAPKNGVTRRGVLTAFSMAAAMAGLSPLNAFAQAAGNGATAQKIANHFSSVKTMMGEFVQFGPRGEQTGGKFYIERPGKLRFNYEDPSPMRVIADGKNVVIGNMKLKTWDLYPLSKTPLSLLLSDKIDLGNQKVRNVKEESDLTTIVLGDKSIFRRFHHYPDVRPEDLRSEAVDDDGRPEQGHDRHDLQRSDGREPR